MISRLNHRDDFQALRRHGSTARRGSLQVVYRPACDSRAGIRVAFAIGRDVGTAVVRNRLRRRLRFAMNELSERTGGLPAGDYLIRATKAGVKTDSSKLREILAVLVEDLRPLPEIAS